MVTPPETLAQARRADRLHRRSRELAALAAQVTGVQIRMAELVAGLRRDGASWAQIGALIGVSKQAAQQRYDKAR